MRYNGPYQLGKKDELDLGIDLFSNETVTIKPGHVVVVDTGTTFEFPSYGKIRRFIMRLLFGSDVTGIGGILRPRGGHKHDVLSGVVDVGYRDTIKVRVHNAGNEVMYICRGDSIAQLVPILAVDLQLEPSTFIDKNTKRGGSGGINVRVK